VLEKLGPLDADRIADLRPYLESVPDPRSRRGRWYSLTAILLMCACAAVCGAKSIDELAEFGERATNSLLASLGVRRHPLGWRRSPKPVTLGRVLQALDGDALDQAVGAYLADRHRFTASADMPEARSRQIIAVDGKALKGSARLAAPRRHLLSAVTHGRVATIAQVEVGAKTNEVRHDALCRIPGSAGKNSEGGSWARWLTQRRKPTGTRACHGNLWPCPEIRNGAQGSPRDMAKAGLPESQSPVMQLFIHRKRSLKPVPRSASDCFVGGATSGALGDVQ